MGEMARIDRRVLKTKRAIRNAFAMLLSVKDINEITIKDIADAADINRKTFYSYYSGVHAVLEEIENEIVSDFDEALTGADYQEAMSNPYVIFRSLTGVLNRDMDFYSHLMRMEGNASLVTKIIRRLKQRVKDTVAAQFATSEETLDLIVSFAVSGMFSVYQDWFNSDRAPSIEKVSRKLSVVIFAGVNGLIAKKEP